MNVEQELKVQAWMDGELSEAEARQMADFTNADRAAQALANELRMAKAILAGNEPERKLPESPEFYWSKIQREIERHENAARAEARPVSWLLAWRRWLAPLSGVALIAFLTVFSTNIFRSSVGDEGMNYLVEVENLSDHVSSISYKSHSEKMFVVYLYPKDAEAEGNADSEPLDDTVIQ